jgi:hypothetical protein
MKLSKIIHVFHMGVSLYVSCGWMFPIIHNKILIGFIPSIFVNWLVDEHRCILTRLETHYAEIEDEKGGRKIHINNEGFIQTKLKSYNIHCSADIVNKFLLGIMFHTFIQSYYNVILL